MRYFFHYFLVIPTNFRHSFGHPQNETPHKHRAQPSRNALFFRSTAPLSAKCSAAPEAAAKHKDRLPNVPFSRRSSVAPAGVEPTMGESKSPALPLGDGALNLAKYKTRLQRPTASVATTEELGIIGETERNAVHLW